MGLFSVPYKDKKQYPETGEKMSQKQAYNY
jgi:hypothetical protein